MYTPTKRQHPKYISEYIKSLCIESPVLNESDFYPPADHRDYKTPTYRVKTDDTHYTQPYLADYNNDYNYEEEMEYGYNGQD